MRPEIHRDESVVTFPPLTVQVETDSDEDRNIRAIFLHSDCCLLSLSYSVFRLSSRSSIFTYIIVVIRYRTNTLFASRKKPAGSSATILQSIYDSFMRKQQIQEYL